MPRNREGSIYPHESGGGTRYGFVIDIQVPGAPRRQVRRQGYSSKREARLERDRIRAQIDVGRYVEPSRQRLVDYLGEWIATREELGDLRRSTIHRYKMDLARLGGHDTGFVTLSQLRPGHLDRWYQDLLRDGGKKGQALSPTTVRHAHNVVNKALADAVRKEILVRNPAEGASAPRRRQLSLDELPTWSSAEVAHFLGVVQGSKWEPLWRLALLTGARQGELLALMWPDVDFEQGLVHIKRGLVYVDGKITIDQPKTAAGVRVVSLDRATVRLLALHQQRHVAYRQAFGPEWNPQDLLFPNVHGEPCYPNTVYQAWVRAVRQSGLRHIPFHGMRHTHATILHHQGEALSDISRRLGHASKNFTFDRYTHADVTSMRDMGERLAVHLDGLHHEEGGHAGR